MPGDVEADADAEPIEIEVETADDVDDDVDAVAAAKLEEQMAALQQDLDAEATIGRCVFLRLRLVGSVGWLVSMEMGGK